MGDWRMVGGLAAVGLAVIAFGAAARTGRTRRWAYLYFNPDMPPMQRHFAFAAIPLGAALLLLAGALALVRAGGPGSLVGLLGILLFLVALLVLAGAFTVAMWPPRWSKPAWLLERDAARRAGGDAAARGMTEYERPEVQTGRRMSPTEYRIAWAGITVLGVVWWLLDWSPSVYLTGIGVSIPFLVALRPLTPPPAPPAP